MRRAAQCDRCATPFYRWRPHPWHGLDPGKDPPRIVQAFIEITPFDSVGGLKMIDQGEADDKIVAVLENDNFWGDAKDIGDLSQLLIERLNHYFLTYKLVPGTDPSATIESVFAAEHAHEIIQAALDDYVQEFGE